MTDALFGRAGLSWKAANGPEECRVRRLGCPQGVRLATASTYSGVVLGAKPRPESVQRGDTDTDRGTGAGAGAGAETGLETDTGTGIDTRENGLAPPTAILRLLASIVGTFRPSRNSPKSSICDVGTIAYAEASACAQSPWRIQPPFAERIPCLLAHGRRGNHHTQREREERKSLFTAQAHPESMLWVL